MTAAALGQSLRRRLEGHRDGTAALMLFAGTLFLSALLLFSVQPMFAKMVLPRLGGSPSVWAVSMCFFQAVLLAGYCYAHALNRLVPPRIAPIIHLTLLGIALLALPIGLRAGWSEPPAGDAYLWLIGALGAGVGLPFFAVSANAPLLQAWFARSGHPHARDPYFLYGASNFGSLIALLAYPVLIEPFSGLASQTILWTAGFVALGISIAVCGVAMATAPSIQDVAPGADTARAAKTASPTWAQRALWIGLAAVPSGLLVAFSSYLTTDIGSAPFLWVLPLAAFLATFILVFTERPVVPHRWMLNAQPVLVTGVMLGLAISSEEGWLLSLVSGCGVFFVTTMVAHRELYDRRPASEHLTEFYLFMSLGGVLGGMFAALVAPKLFSTIWEFPLLVTAGLACRPGVLSARPNAEQRRHLLIFAAAGLLTLQMAFFGLAAGKLTDLVAVLTVLLGGAAIAMLVSKREPVRQLIAGALMLATIAYLPSGINTGASERSFFGVHWVSYTAGQEMRLLMHGTTIHGAERLLDPLTGTRPVEPVPATYYHPQGPMAQGVGIARGIAADSARTFSVGIVGLGAGSLACYSRAAESWRFFEIDPVVVRIARDPNRFSFLSHCRPDNDIVIGDARLTLGKEAPAKFDYLVVDAFSSDAVPVHLLTVEALQLYLSKLAPDGLLALHISNRHLDLIGVVGAITHAIPGIHAVLADDKLKPAGFDATRSQVVFVTRSKETLERIGKLPFASPLVDKGVRPWTDDYTDVLSAMLRKRG
ncbi:MAG: fused MFS/spermidine synthase [Proteobacteria bacterium]|nr:fused MFS/spermidine synthase [Pseudomonadota bacterium]